ncbi:MAG: TonB-dependent receptor [Lewinellaceae bacterium]|nr:TonB-dependent receptor [Lewinellaceae bacterium]
MKRLFTFLVYTLFLGSFLPGLHSQSLTIRGQVLTAQLREPIPGTTVYLEPGNQLRETDRNGQYVFPDLTAGNYQLTVFAEGYAAQTQAVNLSTQPVVLTFELTPLEVNMQAVTVDGTAAETYSLRRLRNVEGMGIYAAKKSEVIELKNIVGNLAANNAREIYKGVAGLTIWENDNSGIQLNIGARGLDPNRTTNFNTRQNGYDISADALGYPESYYTPPAQALARIDIVRGAASLQYGTQFGGLLNFVFKEGPADKPFQLFTENTLGSFGFRNTFTSIGGSAGPVRYYGFYQYKTGDGWRPNAGFDQHTAFAHAEWQLGKRLRIGVEHTFMRYLAQQPGGLTDFEFRQDARQSNRARNWFRVHWNLSAATLDYSLSERTQLNMRHFLLDAERSSLGELGAINRPDPLRERDLIQGRYQNYGMESRLIHRYPFRGQTATFLTGVRYYRGNTRNRQGDGDQGSDATFQFQNPENLEQSNYTFPSRNAAWFAENLFNLTEKWSVTPGIRLEYIRTASEGYYQQRVFSGGKVIFSQRIPDARQRERTLLLAGIGTGYRLREELEIYANISQNYRSINFSDLAVVNPNLLIDSLLQDERGYNADLGIRGTLLQGLARIDASLFYLAYNNRIGLREIIVPDPVVVERPVAYRTNIGDARILGLELYAEADIWKLLWGSEKKTTLLAFVNGSAIQGEYLTGGPTIAGKQVELIPPLSLKTGLNYRRGTWGGSLLFSYIHEHYSDATNARFVANATRGIVPSFGLLDLGATYTWKQWRISGGLNNVTDERYFTRRAQSYPGPGIIPGEGRSFYVGVGVQL